MSTRLLYAVFMACLAGWAYSAQNVKPSLQTVFQQHLDEDLAASLKEAQARARQWQGDARLHEVRLNVRKDGTVAWRFLWLSDAAGASLQTHSNAPSLRVVGSEPGAKTKATLDLESTVGFERLGSVLKASGVDLGTITTDQIETIQLGHETHLDPAGFYYYVFLTSGEQHWVRAEDGVFVK